MANAPDLKIYRKCELCHYPMEGIMRGSDPPPRYICQPCGGIPASNKDPI